MKFSKLNISFVGMALFAGVSAQAQLTLNVSDQVYLPGEEFTVDVLIINGGNGFVNVGGSQALFGLSALGGGSTAATFGGADFQSGTIWESVLLFDGQSTSGTAQGVGTGSLSYSFEALGSENVTDFASVSLAPGEQKTFAKLKLDTSGLGLGEVFQLDLSGTKLSDDFGGSLVASAGSATFTPVPEPEDAVWVAGLACLCWVGFRRWRQGAVTAVALAAMTLGSGLVSESRAEVAVVDAGAHVSRVDAGRVKVSIRVSGRVTIYGMNLRLRAEGLSGSQVMETIVRGEGDFLLPASEVPANVIRVNNGVEAQWATAGEDGYTVPEEGATLAEFVIELGEEKEGAGLDLGFAEYGLQTELLDEMGNLLPVMLKGGSVSVGEKNISVHGWEEQAAMVVGSQSLVRVGGEESGLTSTWVNTSGMALGPELGASGEYKLRVEQGGEVVWESGETYVEVFEPGVYGLRLRPRQQALFAYLPEGGVWTVEQSESLQGGWVAAMTLEVSAGEPVAAKLPDGALGNEIGFFRLHATNSEGGFN